MARLKGMLGCGVALGGFIFALPAQAMLTVTATDAGVFICNATDSGVGIATLSCTNDPNFLVISVTATGSPILVQPGLITSVTEVTSNLTTTDTLKVEVDQTGLSFLGGQLTADVTPTTVAGPMTLQADAPGGTSILSQTFSTAGPTQSASTTVAAINNDAAIYSLTFNGPFQTSVAAISVTGELPPPPAPEPASLALLATALAGFFGLRRWSQC